MSLREAYETYLQYMSVPDEKADEREDYSETLEVGPTINEWAHAREIDMHEFCELAEAIQSQIVLAWMQQKNMGPQDIPLTVSFHCFAVGFEYARQRYSNV